MNIPTKKLQNGFEVPVLGLGTYGMGNGQEHEDERDVSVMRQAIELGVTHLDTAEVYAEGRAERLLGQAIRGFERSKLCIASKVGEFHLNYKDIKRSVKGSLSRIGTDYIDIYYLHRRPPEDTFEECVRAMNELVDEGLMRHIAISNFNLEHTKRAVQISKHPIVATQVHYNLIFREPEISGLLEYCKQSNILVVAYRPVNKGSLHKPGTDNITEPGIPILDEMCKKYGRTQAQIAINWLISQPNIVTLVKTSSVAHLYENLGAIEFQMDPKDVEKLAQEFPGQKIISDTVPLA